MKKLVSLLLVCLCLGLAGCKKAPERATAAPADETSAESEVFTTLKSLGLSALDPAGVLTVYFSHNDEVKAAAEYIAEENKGGIFEIKTSGKYPDDAEKLRRQAHEEHEKNVRPALVGAPTELRDYDVVFLCFPEWDSTMPMALFTFVEDYDMRDKTVIPLCCGTAGGLENAVADLHRLSPELTVAQGFAFGGKTEDAVVELTDWLIRVLYGK